MGCPNVNLESWKELEASVGTERAYYLWDKYDGKVPQEEYSQDVSIDLIPQIQELNNFVLFEDQDKLCAGGICNLTAAKSTEILEKAGLNPFPNPYSYGGDSLPVTVKSPLGDFFIQHYVAASAINDSIYIYDMPQNEFISDEDFGMGNVSLKTAFKPRLIPLTIDSIKANYNLNSKDAAKFIRDVLNRTSTSINPTFRSYIQNNIKNSEEYIKSLEDQISSEGVMLDAREEYKLKQESLEELKDKKREAKLSRPLTGKEENKVINFLRNKLKLKTKEYLPTKSLSFTLGNIIKSVTGLNFDYSRENLDTALNEFKNYTESDQFLSDVWDRYSYAKSNLDNINQSLDRLFSFKRLLDGFFKLAKTEGIKNALSKYDSIQQHKIKTFLPRDILTKYASDKQAVFMLEKTYSNINVIIKSLNINFGKPLTEIMKDKMKLNAQFEKANTVLNYLKAVDFDASYIYESIANEAKRRYAYFEKQGNVSFQVEEMPMSAASPETVNKIKELAKSVGINFQDLLTYAKNNPTVDVKNATGLADLTKGIIALATGREDVAITEEFVHIATAIIEQVNPELVTQMIAKIDRFKIYKQTLEAYKNNKNYQLSNGKPDIRKIKKEAVDKLIAEVIISQEQGGETDFPDLLKETDMSTVRMWWNYIMDKIRGIYNSSNIDIFRSTAALITKGEIGGTVADIKEANIFLQQKNDAVDKFYNTIIEEDSKLELIPATYDAQGNVIKKRHYTDQGEEVAKTVTELLDEEDKMVDRTEFQKSQDKQKMNWGDKGHVFIYNVLSNDLIDKDGYALANPKTSDIKTPLNENIQMHIRSFLTELIASYKPGTRFIIEKKAINRKVKGKLASTIDFIAIEPNEKTGVKVDTLDWKFTSINKSYQEDVPWYKSKKWIKQMAEYVKMLYNYGLKPNQLRKSRMVPFQANYLYQSEGDPKSGLILNSLEIGKLDSAKETNFYLLPVPLPTESTGSSEIDRLIKSLREYYEKLYNKPVSPEERYAKILYTNELSKAIRALHVKIDFKPLASIGDTFLRGAAKTFKSFENIDYSKLTDEEIRNKLKELLEFQKSAEKFATLDDAFLSHFPKEGLSEEDKKTLSKLVEVSSATGRMMNKIIELQNQYVIQLAASKGVSLPIVEDDAGKKKIQAEVEIKGLAKTFLEGSQLSAKLINIGSNLLMNTQSLVSIEANKLIEKFGKKLLALEEEVRGTSKTAFDMIGTVQGDKLKLIRKIDKRFWENVNLAKEAKDKQWLMENMDVEKYNKFAQEAIDKGRNELEKITFSSDLEEDSAERSYRVQKLIDSLDINSPTFNGYDGYQFAYIFNRCIFEDQHLSPEYKQMAKSQNALEVWKFFTGLNERAKAAGYLVEEGVSFFPLMEATMLQKLSASDNVVRQMKDFWKDGFSVRVNEQQTYSKTDPETGELKKQIPKLFTRTDKAVDQLSKDLNKVGSLWIRSLLEYETSKNLEDILLTLHSVEKAKGSIVVDEGQKIIWEGGAPKITQKSNKNADVMQTIIDDGLYGISENLSSLGNVALGITTEKLTKGDEQKKENRALASKKVLNNANKLTQALAVGLRTVVAIPNYFGYHFQTYTNSGGFYRFGEFEKNNVKTTLGNLNTIQKGLLDLITPLNEDVSKEKIRKLAKQQGYIKWLSTWNFTDVMMVTNSFPERKLQFANALSFIDNAMVIDGKIVNIRQYVRAQDQTKYRKDANRNYIMSQAERKQLEDSFEERVQKLKETSSLEKIAKIENDEIIIPGVSNTELAKFRTKIIEFGRNLNGQMNSSNKADYRRDTIFRSFMMFKTWIPKQVSLRTLDIKKNIETDEWTYGRSRAFIKTWANLGFKNILKMRQIIQGTDEGLAILDEMLEAKREDYFKKTGQQLEITNEEFYDLMRRELKNQLKELQLLFGTLGVIVAAKVASPPDDEDASLTKNQYKYILKMINKISDEITFYYNPLTLETMTKGSILPSLGLLTRAENVIKHTLRYGYGEFADDEKVIKDAHPLKYFLDFIPGPSQFNKEILPLIDPELAKDLGIRVTSESR